MNNGQLKRILIKLQNLITYNIMTRFQFEFDDCIINIHFTAWNC